MRGERRFAAEQGESSPSQVGSGVTYVGQFPVENRNDYSVSDYEVADAVVAVTEPQVFGRR